jgi:hypothetical protein
MMMPNRAISVIPHHAQHAAPNIGDWLGFFGAVAGVSATLFSVMFITFQVKSDTWNSSRLKQITALAALFELLIPLFMALIALMADHPWRVAAWVSGGLGILVVAIHWFLYVRDRSIRDNFDLLQARGAWISFAVYSTMIVGGGLGNPLGLYLMGGTSIWLLFSGAFEAWWHLEPRGVTPPSP